MALMKRIVLVLGMLVLAATMVPQAAIEAQEPNYVQGFEVSIDGFDGVYQSEIIWIQSAEGVPVAIRSAGGDMVEIGYYGDFSEGYVAPEFTFIDAETGEPSSATMDSDGNFFVNPGFDPDHGYDTDSIVAFDWEFRMLRVRVTWVYTIDWDSVACLDWEGFYPNGTHARAQVVPFKDASNQRFKAYITLGGEFFIMPDGNPDRGYTSPTLTYEDPNIGSTTVSVSTVTAGATLNMIDWDGATFSASLINCQTFPFPLFPPRTMGGWG